MATEWKVKSESDTDVVFHEVDWKGRETGNFRYAGKTPADPVVDITIPGYTKVPRRWPWISATVAQAVLILAAIIRDSLS